MTRGETTVDTTNLRPVSCPDCGKDFAFIHRDPETREYVYRVWGRWYRNVYVVGVLCPRCPGVVFRLT